MSDSFCVPMDYSPSGFSVQGIFQARILEQVAISFSRGSSSPKIEPASPTLASGFFTTEPPGKPRTWFQFSSVQSLSRVWLLATPWIAAHQASLSITNSRSSLKLMCIESVMPSSHLILCRPLLLPPIPLSIRVSSNESTFHIRRPKYWSFSLSISPSKEHPALVPFRMDWLDPLDII